MHFTSDLVTITIVCQSVSQKSYKQWLMNNFLKITFLANNRAHSTESSFFFLKRLYFDLTRKAEMWEENSFWSPIAEGCYLLLFYGLSKLAYGRGRVGRL